MDEQPRLTFNLMSIKDRIFANSDEENKRLIKQFDKLSLFQLHTELLPNGETPLHWAASRNPVITRYLLIRGFVPDQHNYRGTTALYYAAMNMQKDCITLLLNGNGVSIYPANPAIRSGFSGLLPMQYIRMIDPNFTENTCYQLLRNSYDKNIPVGYISEESNFYILRDKYGFFLSQSTRYRIYMFHLMLYNKYMAEFGRKHEDKWSFMREKLIEFSNWMDVKPNECPYCMKEIKDGTRCEKCSKIYCCKEHKEFKEELKQLHGFDCKQQS